jgi:ribosomal protein S18 acetylase RimI-like enzyme
MLKLIPGNCDLYNFVDGTKKIGKVRLVPAGQGGWYLANFLIYSRYRGNGYGNNLMEAVMLLARRKRKKSIFLWVSANNEAAIKIYNKAGFKRLVDGKICLYLWLSEQHGQHDRLHAS